MLPNVFGNAKTFGIDFLFEIAHIVGNSQWVFCMIINAPEPYQFRIIYLCVSYRFTADLVRMLL